MYIIIIIMSTEKVENKTRLSSLMGHFSRLEERRGIGRGGGVVG